MNQSIQSVHNSLRWSELYNSVCISYSGRFLVAFLLTLLIITPLNQVYGAEDGQPTDKSRNASTVDATNEADSMPEPEADSDSDLEPTQKSLSDEDTNEAAAAMGDDQADLDDSTTADDLPETSVPNTEVTETVESDESATIKTEQSSSTNTTTQDAPNSTESVVAGTSTTTDTIATTDASTTTKTILSTEDTASTTLPEPASAAGSATSLEEVGSASSSDQVSDVSMSTTTNQEQPTQAETEDVATTTVADSTPSTDSSSNNEDQDTSVDETVQPDVQTTASAPSMASTSSSTAKTDVETTEETNAIVKSIDYTSDANRYQFSADSCVTVAQGGYYCMNTDRDMTNTTDGQIVYAAQQANGFSDIFLQSDGDIVRITDNQYDDTAPYYDAASQSIVWHRVIDDVYQIVSYDLDTKEETIFTDTVTNNMQPVRSDEVTVWQRWVDTGWQVMVQVSKEEPQQITSGTNHNLAPYVNGDYVIWNVVTEGEEKQVGVYEITTGNISYIDDTDGGQVTNPRFVLMYDTKYTNGDTITKGFDPETGEVVPLAAAPAPESPDIPESDPVGETRALLNNKTNNEEDELEVEIVNTKDTRSTASTSADSAISSSTQPASTTSSTLDLSAVDTASTSDSVATTSTTELSDYDLPIAPFGTTTEPREVSSTTDTSVGSSTADLKQTS